MCDTAKATDRKKKSVKIFSSNQSLKILLTYFWDFLKNYRDPTKPQKKIN